MGDVNDRVRTNWITGILFGGLAIMFVVTARMYRMWRWFALVQVDSCCAKSIELVRERHTCSIRHHDPRRDR